VQRTLAGTRELFATELSCQISCAHTDHPVAVTAVLSIEIARFACSSKVLLTVSCRKAL
jgi:hypothetical protein